MKKPELKIFLAAPRGFCAGVDRAIQIVEMALEKWGAPVYVRHEIVHNKFVVDGLRDKVQFLLMNLMIVLMTARYFFRSWCTKSGTKCCEKQETSFL